MSIMCIKNTKIENLKKGVNYEKKLFYLSIVIILIISIQSCATIVISQESSKVVKIEGKSKDDLYIRANTWMVETFNNAESVIQFSDKENGIVTGKYIMANIIASNTTRHNVYSIIKIQVKDGAARITIIPDSYKNDANIFAGGISYPIEKMNADIEELINNFTNSKKETESDDWQNITNTKNSNLRIKHFGKTLKSNKGFKEIMQKIKSAMFQKLDFV